jgi:hydrophobic/amphiphilic exporter-1 (mainly G- bacteria), HAE1 family
MTSFAFILGAVPLWTATGAGAVARQIMGTTVIGVLAASLVGIFFIPAMFYLVEKWSGAGKQHQVLATAEGAAAEADQNEASPFLVERRSSTFRLYSRSEL